MSYSVPIYSYFWKNNPTREAWHGRPVYLIVSGAMNSVVIEDCQTGARMVTHRRAIRRLRAKPKTIPEGRQYLSLMGGVVWADPMVGVIWPK